MRITRLAVGLSLCVGGRAAADPAAELFVPTKVWSFHLTVPAKDFAGMEPAGGGFPGFGPPGFLRKDTPKADKPADVHKGGSFGLEFPWAHAEFTADGQIYKDVGLRYKGGGSYVMSAGRLKRNLKVDLSRYEDGQRFHGLKSLNLNAGTMDPTKLKEALAFSVFREAGLPTPRTSFAELTLTVPGKYDNELVGTYTLIEQVDKTFLKDRFKSAKGLLMKPEVRPGTPGNPLMFRGDDWEPYKAALGLKDEATKAQADRVIAFVKLINGADNETFRKQIGDYLDVDNYLRFLAVTALVANLDSFFVGGHNAYLYLHPETNKIVFIPWDLDLAFGGFFLLGPADQQADLSITHPYPGEHKLTDRLLAIPEIGERYKKLVRELTTTVFTKEKLAARLTELEKATKGARDRETKAVARRRENPGFGGFPGGPGGQSQDLRAWVDRRLTSVTGQLDGKSKGTIPGGFGFGGPPGGGPGGMRPPRPGEVMPDPLRGALRLTDEQRKKFDELQREIDRRVEQLLTEEQRATLKRMREARPPGGFPGGPPPGGFPGGPPPGKGPGE